MSKLIDLTGQQFGYLTVLERDLTNLNKTYWKCQCECGKITIVDGYKLRNNKIKSCGCMKSKLIADYQKMEDLSGQTFNNLTVISYDEKTSNERKKSFFLCKCNLCGNIKSILGTDIKSGHTQACGCMRRSRGELKIEKLLNNLQFSFETEKTYGDLIGTELPLRFDFYLPKYNTCIEYQGEQHYKDSLWGGENSLQKRQSYDQKKREYCKKHNIKLIEIPYWDYNKLDENYLCNLINS